MISDLYGQSQKARDTEDTFSDDLQVLARKIIVPKPSFRKEANQQWKDVYAHNLWDQYYAAIAHSALQSSWRRNHLQGSGDVWWQCLEGMQGRAIHLHLLPSPRALSLR